MSRYLPARVGVHIRIGCHSIIWDVGLVWFGVQMGMWVGMRNVGGRGEWRHTWLAFAGSVYFHVLSLTVVIEG